MIAGKDFMVLATQRRLYLYAFLQYDQKERIRQNKISIK